MSKALTAIFALFVVAAAIPAVNDAQDHPDHRIAVAGSAAALVVVLLGLLLTRRLIPAERRRGEHIERRPGPGSWLLGIPLVIASGVVLVASFIAMLAIAGDVDGSIRIRRIARHAWRTWTILIGASIASGMAIERLDGDAPVTFAIGCVGLAATRLGTRWMDRSDAAVADPAAGAGQRIGTSATSELPSPIQLG